jgi:hypothetical protein
MGWGGEMAGPSGRGFRGRGRSSRTPSDRRKARSIGDVPDIADPERRAACRKDFKLFCTSYFPEIFYLPWSDDQLRCVDKIEEVILRGGLFALAMPRGSGKTALCQTAVVWAQAYGHKRYIYFLGDDQESAEDSLASIKTEWEANLNLAADFPEISLPLIRAEGMSVRFHGQTCYGERVQCHWGSDKIVLPSIQFPGCPAGWEAWLKPLKDRRPLRQLQRRHHHPHQGHHGRHPRCHLQASADRRAAAARPVHRRRYPNRQGRRLAQSDRQDHALPGIRRPGPGRTGRSDLWPHAVHRDPGRAMCRIRSWTGS